MTSAIDLAKQLILGDDPPRESEGKNRSPIIDAMNREVHAPLGSPWCASFVSYCFKHAQGVGVPFPYSAGSQAILSWFRAHGLSFTDPDRLLRCKGALGGWTDSDGQHGHIFLIGERYSSGSEVLKIGTWEGNTSPQTKGRDGEGAYALTRSIDELRRTHPRFWFLDCSGIRGGQFWK